MIELLGRLASEEDWVRIEHWMDNGDADVKIAAAQASVRSTRPLAALVRRRNDPIIQPILILAAQKRGQSEETMLALIGIKPTQDQSAQAWQNALVEMARRAPPLAVLHTDQALGRKKKVRSFVMRFSPRPYPIWRLTPCC